MPSYVLEKKGSMNYLSKVYLLDMSNLGPVSPGICKSGWQFLESILVRSMRAHSLAMISTQGSLPSLISVDWKTFAGSKAGIADWDTFQKCPKSVKGIVGVRHAYNCMIEFPSYIDYTN